MVHNDALEKIVVGLGFELVDIEWSQQGLLRVFIDGVNGHVIDVNDCELVSKQLSHWLFVEQIDYRRLEVSSPGLDRPLKKIADFERFVGAEVAITLRNLFQGRKHFKGVLLPVTRNEQGDDLVQIQLSPELDVKKKPEKGGAKRSKGSPSKAKVLAPMTDDEGPELDTVLSFTLDELKQARLVPKFDLRSKKHHDS